MSRCRSVLGLIWRGILSDPIGLCQAVGGAILRADVLFGSILSGQVQAGLKVLPLLRGIADGQPTFLLYGQSRKMVQEHSQASLACAHQN